MRTRTILATLCFGTTLAAAQPSDPYEEPPAPVEAPPSPSPAAPSPSSPLPPINITITNNNSDTNTNNNSDTSTNDQTNDQQQDNTQTNTQTNEQTNTNTVAPVTTPLAPPALTPPVRGPQPAIERIPMPPRRTKWLAIGVFGGHDHDHDRGGDGRGHGGGGIRASLDLLGRRAFTLGIAATASHRDGGSGVVYVAYTRKLWKLDLRAHIGFGVGGNRGDRDDDDRDDGAPSEPGTPSDTTARTVTGETDDDDRDRDCGPRAEAGLLVGLPLGKRLGLIAGPYISSSRRDHDHAHRDDGERRHRGGPPNASMLVGLRYRF